MTEDGAARMHRDHVHSDGVDGTEEARIIDGARAGDVCETCAADLAFLRSEVRPDYERAPLPIRVVDLFAGGGGLTMGAAEAAHRAGRGITVALAVEHDDAAADVYALNFPDAQLARSDVTELFDGTLGAPWSTSERNLARGVGQVDILLAGPPCQGHSDLNNHTRRRDPRNALYACAARAAEVLRPTFVVIENVPAVLRDNGGVVDCAAAALEAVGYAVHSKILDLVRFGVPQRRRRHILLAVLDDLADPAVLLDTRSPCDRHGERSVRWAIADLLDKTQTSGQDAPSNPTTENLARMQWLIDEDEYNLPNSMRPKCHRDFLHTYKAMYGRLAWDNPAPTITTGFGSMGQGRFVHPAAPRTITPHEAARLQTLPDFFDLDVTKGRSTWARVIGNAVPPLLGAHLVEPLLCALPRRNVGRGSKATSSRRSQVQAEDARNRRRNGVTSASNEVIRIRMANTKRQDTKPELELRSALHRMGLRFSVDRPISGSRRRVDIVFPTERVAVYVDGCFWHNCPQHSSVPKQNTQWWLDKLAVNRQRDTEAEAALRADGWTVLRFWQHDNVADAAAQIYHVVTNIRRCSSPDRSVGAR